MPVLVTVRVVAKLFAPLPSTASKGVGIPCVDNPVTLCRQGFLHKDVERACWISRTVRVDLNSRAVRCPLCGSVHLHGSPCHGDVCRRECSSCTCLLVLIFNFVLAQFVAFLQKQLDFPYMSVAARIMLACGVSVCPSLAFGAFR